MRWQQQNNRVLGHARYEVGYRKRPSLRKYLERGEVGRGRDVVELIDSMAAVLTEVADRTDPMRVHLAAACLELDDPVAPDARPLGVLLVDHLLGAASTVGSGIVFDAFDFTNPLNTDADATNNVWTLYRYDGSAVTTLADLPTGGGGGQAGQGPGGSGGAGDGCGILLEGGRRRQPRTERRSAVADRDVDGIGLEIGNSLAGQDAQVDPGVCGGKCSQAWDQPFRREGRRHADGQMCGLGAKGGGGRADQVESLAEVCGIGTSRFSQCQGSGLARKEVQAEMRFQLADLLRDSALGHAKLFGGKAKIQVTRRGLEGAQTVQRRKAYRHAIDFLLNRHREYGNPPRK